MVTISLISLLLNNFIIINFLFIIIEQTLDIF